MQLNNCFWGTQEPRMQMHMSIQPGGTNLNIQHPFSQNSM